MFGTYPGGDTGSSNDINVGFKPKFIMVKSIGSDDGWIMFDTLRMPATHGDGLFLKAHDPGAEGTSGYLMVRWTNTGWYWDSTGTEVNSSGNTYIYMAFA